MESTVETHWFTTALLLIFVALKLTGHITWSWWWVLSPLWGPLVIAIAVWAVFLAFLFVVWVFGRGRK